METQLDNFEKVLEDGLVKMCHGAGLVDEMIGSEDIEKWWDVIIKDYVADAVDNFNSYPEAALGFAAFLGMGVAFNWDKDWSKYKDRTYSYYYGTHGFDDMDDHILCDVLKLDPQQAERMSSSIKNCSIAALELMRHEQIEIDTAFGFYALTRCYCVMFRLGAAIQLKALGYRKEPLSGISS